MSFEEQTCMRSSINYSTAVLTSPRPRRPRPHHHPWRTVFRHRTWRSRHPLPHRAHARYRVHNRVHMRDLVLVSAAKEKARQQKKRCPGAPPPPRRFSRWCYMRENPRLSRPATAWWGSFGAMCQRRSLCIAGSRVQRTWTGERGVVY